MPDVTVRPDGLITTEQAGVLCGVPAATIRTWIRRGNLRRRRQGNRFLLNIVDVMRTDNDMRTRSRRPAAEPVTWHFEDEPEADADLIVRACAEAATVPLPGLVSVVYYLRFGDRVKIGTTINLRARMDNVPHDELLATERGSYLLEEHRHAQFADLRLDPKAEWFRAERRLLDHAARLREAADCH